MLKALGKVFVAIGKGLAAIFKTAESRGLTDDIMDKATALVSVAHDKYEDNDQRREWAVAALMAFKVPESVARLAVELGVQVIKARQPQPPAA